MNSYECRNIDERAAEKTITIRTYSVIAWNSHRRAARLTNLACVTGGGNEL